MTAVLRRFRVTNFRSVADSGWIDVDEVTALVGVNESGKTNLLLPLWKLNPAKDGEIEPVADYPRKLYTDIKASADKPVFITAVFELPAEAAAEIAAMAHVPVEQVREVTLKKTLAGKLTLGFQNARRTPPGAEEVAGRLQRCLDDLCSEPAMKSEEKRRERLEQALRIAISLLPQGTVLSEKVIADVCTSLTVDVSEFPKTSTLVPLFMRAREIGEEIRSVVSQPAPEASEEVRNLAMKYIPKFVYYSNYGNLDSEIYLPHVIANLRRTDLGSREQAKSRTLKVLFDFVQLKPEEILQLGQQYTNIGRELTPQEAEIANAQKKERSVLLQSASTQLTRSFKEWWKQGDYRFRFEADGGHFRIWVSDDRRPEEVELENRSSGLQWFLSFYLVFLVESEDSHEGAVLLLDEPGLSLHPIAQRDLSSFFNGLAESNQLIFTTHSPFLVEAERLDRVRKVYVDADGTTKASADLGSSGGSAERSAGYAVHAAVGINVAESLLIGCRPIIVEGPSDQHYFNCLKRVLAARGTFVSSGPDLVFVAAGGAKGVRVICSILAGRDDRLPIVIVDGDAQGRSAADALRLGAYQAEPDLVVSIGEVLGMDGAEVEDLIPKALAAREVDRLLRASDFFADVVRDGEPFIQQVERWARAKNVVLPNGWKVMLALRIRAALIEGEQAIDDATIGSWTDLFRRFDTRP